MPLCLSGSGNISPPSESATVKNTSPDREGGGKTEDGGLCRFKMDEIRAKVGSLKTTLSEAEGHSLGSVRSPD